MKNLRRNSGATLSALVLTLSLSAAGAQQTVVLNWNHDWSWMHPMGAMPPGPAGGADSDFSTTWYLKEDVFATLYDGPAFGAVPTVPGLVGTPASFDSGRGPGPIAYGDFQYTGAPLPAGTAAEFPAVASRLTTPNSANRHTGYFRTTFTIPDDGRVYQNPVLRYILDDGGYVYLDGVPILRVNMLASGTDAYTQITEGKVDTEIAIRNAQLFNPVGAPPTGGNNLTTPVIVGNAHVLVPVTSLAPGVHTLAISVHNESTTSSDIGLAVQLTADVSDCVITAAGSTAVRNIGPDAGNLTDDTIDFDVTVTGAGSLSPSGWVVSGPAGSSLIGQTGTYGVARHFAGVPIAEFPAPGGLTLEVQDATTLTSKSIANVQAPQRLGAVTAGAVPGLILTKVPWTPVWTIDEAAGTATLHNSGAGVDRIVESLPVNLSGVAGDVRFLADLTVDNTSTELEAADTFLAELLLSDGVTTTTVNLITPFDVDNSGRMTGGATAAADEFNKFHLVKGAYRSTFLLRAIIPDNIVSATLLLHGINDSASETFTVKNMRFEAAGHLLEIEAAGPSVLDNHGTVNPADDTFSVPVNVMGSLQPPGSLGWTSNATPGAGLYNTPNPVIFSLFPVPGAPQTLTLTDSPVTTVVSNTLSVSPPGPPAVTATLVANSITREANGAGLADDTVTFQATVNGSLGGPGYTTAVGGGAVILPGESSFSATPATFTLSSVPASGTLTVTFTDASYGTATATLAIPVPLVRVIGTVDFGTPAELVATGTPPATWAIDSTLRTLTMNTSSATDQVVESAILNLSAVGAVSFSAKLLAKDTSNGSNFEVTDKFKAELLIDGTVVNLISAWDSGNGSYGSLGPNGPADGYLNGYIGQGATNAEITADYNLYPERDEFNRQVQSAETSIENTFDMAYTIPAEANSVQLKIYGTGTGTTESFAVSGILFTSAGMEPDGDTDGIPDSVEIAAGLNPADSTDAALDLDGDGQSNLAEFRSGTSLTDSASHFHLTGLSHSGASATVRWSSVAGKTYRVQTAASPAGPWTYAGGVFTGAPDNTPGPDFGTQSATVTLPVPSAAKYFLRVVIP